MLGVREVPGQRSFRRGVKILRKDLAGLAVAIACTPGGDGGCWYCLGAGMDTPGCPVDSTGERAVFPLACWAIRPSFGATVRRSI